MTTTPRLWKSQTQVNTSDAPVPMSGGNNFQGDGQIAPLQDGGYVVVWEDGSRTYSDGGTAVVGQRYDSAGNKVGGEVKLSQGFSSGDQLLPAVTALPNGNIAVAFVDRFNGDNDIYVRILNSSLDEVRTDEIDTGTAQTVDPSLTAFADGSYVVSYTLGSGDDTDIVARIVSPTGTVGAQFDIDNQTDNRDLSELATLSDGNFVTVYRDEVAGSLINTDVLFTVLTPAGTLVAGGVVPDADGSGLEYDPDVAALRGGGFVVVWTELEIAPGDSFVTGDIRASLLSNTGDFIASILVNTGTMTGEQNEASVVALADGGFLATWDDDNAGLVRAQRFDAAGGRIGELTVKDGPTPADSPEAALLTDGRIAFAIGDDSAGDNDVTTSIFTVETPNDFNANGKSDILWQSSDGTPAIWSMNGTNAVSVGAAGSFNPGPSWQVKASGDFNGDDHADILWQGSDGTPAIWLMHGTNVLSAGAAGSFNPGPDWQIKGTGDFNGDGKSDILWQGSDGTPAIWLMDGTNAVSVGAVGSFNRGPAGRSKAAATSTATASPTSCGKGATARRRFG